MQIPLALLALLHLAAAAPSSVVAPPRLVVNGQAYECKCTKADSCWPSQAKWDALKTAVGGNLVKNVPVGASCYKSFDGQNTYNSQQCQTAVRNFGSYDWIVDQPHAMAWTLATNNTCNPKQGMQNNVCTLGYQPEYVITAKTKEHVKAGVDFARENNVRLIVRNTGHDFMGRSTGAGSLSINTHSFKTVTFIKNYSGPGNWTGGAVTVGSGIETRELYQQAFQQNPKVFVVGGECPTVGIAGGYVQGGGHGPMTGSYGMGADNVLAFEVVTASGEFVTANAQENPDLFWALKGGGPNSFGVAVSVTLKTFPEVPTAGITLSINSQNQNQFWKGIEVFHGLSNLYNDNGMYVWFALSSGSLSVQPLVAPKMDGAKADQVLKPLYDGLRSASVPFTSKTTSYNTFYEMYTALFQDDTANFNGLIGGRIITRQDITSNNVAIVNAYKNILQRAQQGGGFAAIGGHLVGPGKAVPQADNAVHPVWRDAVAFNLIVYGVADNLSLQQKATAESTMTNTLEKQLRDAAPKGGAYVNEGDLNIPNWQTEFWGSNYPRLLELRKKWDPNGVFYSKSTPGTESWSVMESGTKLCKQV